MIIGRLLLMCHDSTLAVQNRRFTLKYVAHHHADRVCLRRHLMTEKGQGLTHLPKGILKDEPTFRHKPTLDDRAVYSPEGPSAVVGE